MSIKINNEYQNHDDFLEVLLEKSPEFRRSRDLGYINYKQQFYQSNPTFLMSIISNFKKAFVGYKYFSAKHAVLATILTLSMFLVVGASAAELTLPSDSSLRPSNIAKQIYDSLITNENPLKDEAESKTTAINKNGQVYKKFDFSECGLSIVFPEKIEGGVPTTISNPDSRWNTLVEDQLGYSVIAAAKEDDSTGQAYGWSSSFACYSNMPSTNSNSFVNKTKEELEKLTGWNLEQVDISEISVFENPVLDGNLEIIFRHKDTYYSFNVQTKPSTSSDEDFQDKNKLGGVYSSQYEFSFDSSYDMQKVLNEKKQMSNNSSAESLQDAKQDLKAGQVVNSSQCGIDVQLTNVASKIQSFDYEVEQLDAPMRNIPSKITNLVLTKQDSEDFQVASIYCFGEATKENWDFRLPSSGMINVVPAKVEELGFLSPQDRAKVNKDRLVKYNNYIDYSADEVTEYYFEANGKLYEVAVYDNTIGLNIKLK